jgi:protein-S-isoprenylcysteine O-methyltransferase Ste14
MRPRAFLWLKALLFTITVPGSALGLIPGLLISDGRGRAPNGFGLLEILGLALIVAGAGLYASCLRQFVHVGRGTPAPIDAPRTMVAVGAYRYVRNPMYLGVVAALAGETLLFRSLTLAAYTILMGAAFHLFVILYEEPNLTARFGESYRRYRANVPRWIPRLRSPVLTTHD